MELGPSAVTLSPFWAAVRRRRPDVGLVLLADQAPPPDATTAEPDLTAAADRVAGHATGSWAIATGADEPLVPRLAHGPAEHTVVARVRVSARLGACPLDDLESALRDGGWRTSRPRAGLDLLVASRPGTDLRASYADTGVLSLSVQSTPQPVGITRARDLVRAG